MAAEMKTSIQNLKLKEQPASTFTMYIDKNERIERQLEIQAYLTLSLL